MKQAIEFFNTHPDADVVYEALGYLFTEEPEAAAFVAGTSVNYKTIKKQDVIHTPPEPPEGDIQVIHNDATTYGKTAEEVEEAAPKKPRSKPKTK